MHGQLSRHSLGCEDHQHGITRQAHSPLPPSGGALEPPPRGVVFERHLHKNKVLVVAPDVPDPLFKARHLSEARTPSSGDGCLLSLGHELESRLVEAQVFGDVQELPDEPSAEAHSPVALVGDPQLADMARLLWRVASATFSSPTRATIGMTRSKLT